ncbi:NPC intracellular cholesterol transporter 2 homolog a-like [Hylaeus anthracinus]|uniref:NPC intracellular cholesterol transporter 2 homolog a-like n=1 Tax=Hylaeus anthracinus TaxID=313031 RepID=UPI0023B97B4A|nr:NPC intracellular cholesterol transporter 2 homolog a-like [Hylaeus anthracinus]
MAFFTYVYIVAAFLVADSMQTNFQTCSGQPAPTNVVISGCDSLPCPLKRGTNVDGAISFRVLENTKTLKPVVDVQLGEIHMKYPLPQQNACKDLTNAQCPLDKGETVTYHLNMPVEKAYPKVSMIIQLALVDELNKTQMCVKIPAKVVD